MYDVSNNCITQVVEKNTLAMELNFDTDTYLFNNIMLLSNELTVMSSISWKVSFVFDNIANSFKNIDILLPSSG